MSASIDRPCMFDTANQLIIRQLGDGDMTLQTYRMGKGDDFKMHSGSPVLYAIESGFYTGYFDNKKKNKTLYGMTISLYHETRKALSEPRLFYPAEPLALSADTPVDMIQCPSDEGGSDFGFRLIRHKDHIGLSTYVEPHTPDNNVAVWLGHAHHDPFYETLWDVGLETYKSYHKNNQNFKHETVPFGALVAS